MFMIYSHLYIYISLYKNILNSYSYFLLNIVKKFEVDIWDLE